MIVGVLLQAENEELRQGQMALAGELRNLRQQLGALQAAVCLQPCLLLGLTQCRIACGHAWAPLLPVFAWLI